MDSTTIVLKVHGVDKVPYRLSQAPDHQNRDDQITLALEMAHRERHPPPSVADTVSDWRSTRRGPLPPPPERSGAAPRRPSVPPSESDHPAHTEQTWAIGSKFKASEPPVTTPTTERRSLFGGNRPDAAAPSSNPEEVNDWRSGPRRTVSQTGSTRGSRESFS